MYLDKSEIEHILSSTLKSESVPGWGGQGGYIQHLDIVGINDAAEEIMELIQSRTEVEPRFQRKSLTKEEALEFVINLEKKST